MDLARAHVEVHAVERAHAGVLLGQPAHLEHGVAHATPVRSAAGTSTQRVRGGRGEHRLGDLRRAQAVGEDRHPVGRLAAGHRGIGVGDEEVEAVGVALRVPGGQEGEARGGGDRSPGRA